MYYDLRFPYRIEKEAGLAQDENGENEACYVQTKLGQCKVMMTEEEYVKYHETGRFDVAKMLKLNVEHVTCITPQEYEENVGDDDRGDEE